MKRRKIRSLSVSEIGMGCMGFSHGYGQVPGAGYAEEAIREAFGYGCNFSIRQKDTGRSFIIPDITRRLSGVRSEAFAMRL